MPDLDVVFPEGTAGTGKWRWMISEDDEDEESEDGE